MNFIKYLFLLAITTTSSFTFATAQANDDCALYFKASELCGYIEFTQGPFDGLESQFQLNFYTPTNSTLTDPMDLKVDLWMYMGNHGGHGSAPVKVIRQETGVYKVSEVYFIMPGQWNIRVWVNGEQRDMLLVVK